MNEKYVNKLAYGFSATHSASKLIFYFATSLVVATHLNDWLVSLILAIFIVFKIKDFFTSIDEHVKKFLLKDKIFI